MFAEPDIVRQMPLWFLEHGLEEVRVPLDARMLSSAVYSGVHAYGKTEPSSPTTTEEDYATSNLAAYNRFDSQKERSPFEMEEFNLKRK
jgi:hypothetical protein